MSKRSLILSLILFFSFNSNAIFDLNTETTHEICSEAPQKGISFETRFLKGDKLIINIPDNPRGGIPLPPSNKIFVTTRSTDGLLGRTDKWAYVNRRALVDADIEESFSNRNASIAVFLTNLEKNKVFFKTGKDYEFELDRIDPENGQLIWKSENENKYLLNCMISQREYSSHIGSCTPSLLTLAVDERVTLQRANENGTYQILPAQTKEGSTYEDCQPARPFEEWEEGHGPSPSTSNATI